MDNSQTYLYLDDIRVPDSEFDWTIVRSFNEAIEWMLQNGCPSHISFDHDLGMKLLGTKIVTDDYDAKTGYDLAKWIVEKDIECNKNFIVNNFTYKIHSSNITGSENIRVLLTEYLKSKDI